MPEFSQPQWGIGIDIGTTSTKALLCSPQGQVLALRSQGYPLNSPVPQAAQQDPTEILAAVVGVVRDVVADSEINPKDVAFLSFASAMHSLIAVDREGQLLTQSLTWADSRSATVIHRLQPFVHELYRRTGMPVHPMSPLVKLVWLREEKPEIFSQAAKFISIKEYILSRFLGLYAVDWAIAAASGLLNLTHLTWDDLALEVAGIGPERLSAIVPTEQIFHGLHSDFAKAMGLPAETPVAIGASDGILSNLGIGALIPGIVAINIGTSGAIRAVVEQPQLNPELQSFCYPLSKACWIAGAAVNSGGIVLQWFKEQLFTETSETARHLGQNPYELLGTIAERVEPGAAGLLFFPYLTGERSPLWTANAGGSFVGLSFDSTKAQMLRAAFEGIVINLYLVWQQLQPILGKTYSLRVTGSFARSPLGRQLLADIFEREVGVPPCSESGALGAALFGWLAIAKLQTNSLDKLEEMALTRPNPERTRIYRQIIPIYERLLAHLQTEFDALAAIPSSRG